MKVRAYVLFVVAALLTVSAGTKKAKPTVGLNPGDLAPRIEFLGNDYNSHFQNQSGRYYLVNFWAAYDGESRARNVQLWNEVRKLHSDQITMYSCSLDERESVFYETIKADKLEGTNQILEKQGKNSDVYKSFKLKKGFRNFLIDEKGIIIAADVTSSDLKKIIKTI